MKSKMPDELRDEINAYLSEVKDDLEHYLTWANSEIKLDPDAERAADVVEDTIFRLMTISYYLATFFEDSDPSLVLSDILMEVSEEQGSEPNFVSGRSFADDPPNRTRH